MIRDFVLLVLFLLTLVSGRAQGPTESNARYTMRGSVVNSVSGEPVRKALVELSGVQSRRTLTGPDGQFQFEGLPGGVFLLSARRPGFMDPTGWAMVQPAPGSTPIPITAAGSVTVGPDMGNLVIKLVPQARISGHVLDGEGGPVPNLSVQCLQQNVVGGHKIWQRTQAVETDESGSFSVERLSPGSVLVETLQQQVYPGPIADDPASRMIYRRQYYPNAPDIGAAQVINLSPGQEARVELLASTIRATRVFFSVAPPQQWISAVLRDANGDEMDAGLQQNARAGGWILPSVPPGPWTLHVTAMGGNQQLWGEAAIQVGNADLKNVVVALSPAIQVPIVVSGATSAGPGVPPVNVQFVSSRPGFTYNAYPAAPIRFGQEEHLTAQGVAPGTYHVMANGTGAECVGSITSGSSDLSRADYVIAGESSPQGVNIGLRNDCALLEVSVGQRRDQTFSVILSGGPNASEPQLLSYGSSNPSPPFRLSPGDYDVFAFSDLNDLEYANPDVLRKYSSRHVSLSSNQTATVSLDVNVPGERP